MFERKRRYYYVDEQTGTRNKADEVNFKFC